MDFLQKKQVASEVKPVVEGERRDGVALLRPKARWHV